MKRVICLIVVTLILMLSLTACGNMSMGLGNYTFTHVHFTDMTESHCATVEKWYDNSEGIEVMTKEFGSLYLSEGSYIMFGEGVRCPFCH